MRNRCFSWLIAGLLLLWSGVAQADSWMPATRQIVYSSDRHVRLTIDPRQIAGPLQYFDDKVKGREPAGQRHGAPDKAQGWLERQGPDGLWVTVWRTSLVNDVSPVSALVTNDGRHVVTFDNWHSMGYGDDAVVIYGPDGAVVRAMPLTAFLPEDYVAALPRSVSSLHWSGEHGLSADGTRLILEVVIPGEDEDSGSTRHFAHVELALADGRLIPPGGAAWDAAMADAKNALASQRAYEETARRARIAPLLGPTTSGERAWHDYLLEAFFRLDADWADGYPGTTVLRDPAAPDYRASEAWVFDALREHDLPGAVLAFASPTSPDNLVRVLTAAARKVKPGKLHQARIYVAVSDAYRDRVAAALAPTGATFIQLDPARPIPQRPERIPGSPEQAASQAQALEASAKAMDDAADDIARAARGRPRK